MRLVLRSAAAFVAALLPAAALHAQTADAVPATPLMTASASTPPPAALTLPKGVMPPVAMREMTPEEQRAHQVWSLRAALNVAALQCQFSPFLRTVKNYNALLPYHSAEFNKAMKTLEGHFKRHDGPSARAVRQSFDQYTTRTYNSFSTLEAQLGFCAKASEVAWEALDTSRGSFADLAAARLADIRTSLIPVVDPMLTHRLGWVEVPALTNPCLDRKGRQIPVGSKKCR
jgi:hypothetical protein